MDTYIFIKQMSEMTGLSVFNIRYYEKEGLIRNISRNSKGIRIFTAKEVDWISFLKRLRDMGVPLAVMKEYALLREQGDPTVRERKELLKGHRRILLERRAVLDKQVEILDQKVNYYEQMELRLSEKGEDK